MDISMIIVLAIGIVVFFALLKLGIRIVIIALLIWAVGSILVQIGIGWEVLIKWIYDVIIMLADVFINVWAAILGLFKI